uniref:Uncharacterized protein n=1 Tax=Rhizophora mucronata TaxID=61149 RepID=A0A2P2N1I5_RHIMU
MKFCIYHSIKNPIP